MAGLVRIRIIPARAGFTPHRPRQFLPDRDHPRSRGVYLRPSVWQRTLIGSSPLARGLPDGAILVIRTIGIIPARAGFTLARHDTPHGRRDHPRSRGVYQE